EITSKTSIDNQSTQVENSDESSNDQQIVFNEIIKELNTLLNSEQKEILNQLISEENEVYSLFKEAVIAHELSEFEQAVELYTETLQHLETSNQTIRLIELFNDLAINNKELVDYIDAEAIKNSKEREEEQER